MHQRMLSWGKQIGVFLSLLLISTSALALSFIITPKTNTQLPTTVTTTAIAYYTVVNNTTTQRSGNYVSSLPEQVTQTTSGGTYNDTCGSTFTLAAHGQTGDSCTLQLAITGAVANPNAHPLFVCISGGKSCNGTNYPLDVSQTSQSTLTSLAITPLSATTHVASTQQYTATGTYSDNLTANISADVAWTSSNSAAATIDINGLATALAVGSTSISATESGITSNSAAMAVDNPLVSIAITPTSATISPSSTQQFTATGTYADAATLDLSSVVTWHSSNTSAATIDSNGLATGVAAGSTSINASLNPISSDTATLTVASYAYVANHNNNTVSYCLINNDGTFSDCATASSGFNSPSGIVLNSAHTFAYISNYSEQGTVSYCSVNSDGTFSNCASTGSGFEFNTKLALNPAGTKLYVANSGPNNVTFCTVNQNNGSLSDCNTTPTNPTGLRTPQGIVINADNSFAYIANQYNPGYITLCTVNQETFALESCHATAVLINSTSITLNPAGSLAYVTTSSPNNVYYCTVNQTTGELSDCTSTGTGISFPYGISINSAGTMAYIANTGTDNITRCTIDGSGALSSCGPTPIGGYFPGAYDVTVR